jgi:hypothetical protein
VDGPPAPPGFVTGTFADSLDSAVRIAEIELRLLVSGEESSRGEAVL